MKLLFIVLGLLVIGWASARPMMAGSPPMKEPGKNNRVTDHNPENYTDSDNSMEQGKELGRRGNILLFEITGTGVRKGDRERELLSTHQGSEAMNSKHSTQVALDDNTSKTSVHHSETKKIMEENVGHNSSLHVIENKSIVSITFTKQEEENSQIGERRATKLVETEKNVTEPHKVTNLHTEKYKIDAQGKSAGFENKKSYGESRIMKRILPAKTEQDDANLGERVNTDNAQEMGDFEPQIGKSYMVTKLGKDDAKNGGRNSVALYERDDDGKPLHKKNVMSAETDGEGAVKFIVEQEYDTPQDAVKVTDTRRPVNNTKPGKTNDHKVIGSEGEYTYQVSGHRGGYVKAESRVTRGTQQSVISQDRTNDNGDYGDNYGEGEFENEYDGNTQSYDDQNYDYGEQQHDQIEDTEEQNNEENDYTLGKQIAYKSGTKGQNGKPLNSAEKQNNRNGALPTSQFSSPNELQYPSNGAYPQYASLNPFSLSSTQNRTGLLQRPIGNPSMLQQSQPVFDGILNAPYNQNGVDDNDYLATGGAQNANPKTVYLLNDHKQLYAIPAQIINIVGTSLPGGTQGSGIVLLNLSNSVNNLKKSEGNAGIYNNQASSSAGSVDQGNLVENIGITHPNYISQQQPGDPSRGQGLSGGQVLSPLTTFFIGSARPGNEQLQGFSDGISNYFPASSNGGGAIPLKGTPQLSTGNNIYYFPANSNGDRTRPEKTINQDTLGSFQYFPQTGSNGGSERPYKETNQGNSDSFHYFPQTGSNGGSPRPTKDTNQGSAEGFQYNPQTGSNGGSARPIKVANQGNSEGIRYFTLTGSNGGSARPFKEINQGNSEGIRYFTQTGSNNGSTVLFKEVDQKFLEGFQLFPQAGNIVGSTRPFRGTNREILDDFEYFSQIFSNGGSTRPSKVTNRETSSNTINYSPLTVSNISSIRPNKDIDQGSIKNFPVIPPRGNVEDNKIPLKQVLQETSVGSISSVPQQDYYANAGLVQDIYQGIARPGKFENAVNEISLFGGSGSQSDIHSQKLYGSNSSYKPASLHPSFSLNLKDFNVRPQSGNHFFLKEPTTGHLFRETPLKDSPISVASIPNNAASSAQAKPYKNSLSTDENAANYDDY